METEKNAIEKLTENIIFELSTLPKSNLVNFERTNIELNPQDSILQFISHNQRSLTRMWNVYLFITIINYILLILSLIGAFYFAIAKGIGVLTVLLGGTSFATFLTTVIWKPHSKLLQLTNEIQKNTKLSSSFAFLFQKIDKVDKKKQTEIISQIFTQIFDNF